MNTKEKVVKFWEGIPIGFINLITIISGVVTIVTPIIGLIGLKRIFPDKKSFWIIYVVTIVVFIAMLFIMFRYMTKYRKLLVVVRGITTERFFSLTRNFRDTYFDILSYKKTEKLTVELLTEKIEKFLQSALDDICSIYKEFTYQNVSACIKYIDSIEDVDRETATIKTFVRSSDTVPARIEYDDNNPKEVYVKDNTDFYSILSPNSSNRKSYFYQSDLVKYKKDCEKNKDCYNNTTKNWEQYYKATIVVPIGVANKRLFFNTQLTISEIADLSGFASIATFNRMFLTITGTTPTEYKKQLELSII